MTDYDRLNLRGAMIAGDWHTMSRAASAIDGLIDALKASEGDEGLKRSGLYTALSLVAENLHDRAEFIEERREEEGL